MQEHKLIVGHMSQNTAPFSQRVVALQIERRLQSSLVILFWPLLVTVNASLRLLVRRADWLASLIAVYYFSTHGL